MLDKEFGNKYVYYFKPNAINEDADENFESKRIRSKLDSIY